MKSPNLIRIVAVTLAITFLPDLRLLAAQHDHASTQQDPALKVEVNLVSLSVLVTDQNGQSITGLKKEDFKVYEDKVEQPLSFFSSDEAPVSWGLVLDRSGSMMLMMRDVYQAAVHVVDQGTEHDEMFIMTFSDITQLVQDFSSDRRQMENSLIGLEAGGTTALYDAVFSGLNHMHYGKHSKKVLVVLTDGEDNDSRINFRKLIDRAEEADVLIYTVGMFESSLDLGRFSIMGTGSTKRELEKLAEVTGASAHFPTNLEQCKETMKAIAREVSQQYSLGYYPSNPARDGQWRKIKVVVNRSGEKGAKYVARTRTGYYAPKGREGGHP